MLKPSKKSKPKYTPDQIRAALRGLTTSVEIAGAAYGLARNSAYEAVKSGQIESIPFGGKIVCPTAPIRKRLGLEAEVA
jgi:hypothetical protein